VELLTAQAPLRQILLLFFGFLAQDEGLSVLVELETTFK